MVVLRPGMGVSLPVLNGDMSLTGAKDLVFYISGLRNTLEGAEVFGYRDWDGDGDGEGFEWWDDGGGWEEMEMEGGEEWGGEVGGF